MQRASVWGLLLIVAWVSGCTLSRDSDFAQLSIQIPGRPTAQLAPFPSMLIPPANSSTFSCLAVNVVGPGIAPPQHATEELQRLNQMYAGASCSYPGISKLFANDTGITTRVDLKVPSGRSRIVQIAGIEANGTTACSSGNVGHVDSPAKIYELGRVVVDLFKNTAVSVMETYNGLTTDTQREARRVNCGDGSPEPSGVYGALIASEPSLLGYWPLSEGNGPIAYRTGSAFANMTYDAGVSFGAGPGPFATGTQSVFGSVGVAQWAGASHEFMSGSFSIEFWVKYSGSCDANGAFFSMRHGGPAEINILCSVGGFPLLEVRTNLGSFADVMSAVPIFDGQWHLVVGVKESGNDIKIYVDNSSPDIDGGTSFTGNFNFNTSPVARVGSSPTGYQQGEYSHVAIYDTALNAAQIANHYSTGMGFDP